MSNNIHTKNPTCFSCGSVKFYESIYKKEEDDFEKELEELHRSQRKTVDKINMLFGIKKKEYSENFDKKFKEKIKKRDNYQCQLCDAKKDLTIHHIDYNRRNTDENNTITLCRGCNGKVNEKKMRSYYQDYFRKLLHFKLNR